MLLKATCYSDPDFILYKVVDLHDWTEGQLLYILRKKNNLFQIFCKNTKKRNLYL